MQYDFLVPLHDSILERMINIIFRSGEGVKLGYITVVYP